MLKIWSVDINDLLDVNLEGLKKVFALYLDRNSKKNYMNLREAD